MQTDQEQMTKTVLVNEVPYLITRAGDENGFWRIVGYEDLGKFTGETAIKNAIVDHLNHIPLESPQMAQDESLFSSTKDTPKKNKRTSGQM